MGSIERMKCIDEGTSCPERVLHDDDVSFQCEAPLFPIDEKKEI